MLGLLLFMQQPLKAQAASDTAALFTEIRQLQAVYRSALAFDIKYTYTSERRPDSILDVMYGKMEISGNNYHYWLDSVETLVNADYNITLFKTEKVMYLAKPAAVNTVDPVQQLRAVLARTGFSSCSIQQQGTQKIVQINFPAGGAYRQMEMSIDKNTGYVMYMRYVMKTALLMESNAGASEAASAEYGEYAIVQTTFEHYKPLPASYTRFDESSFFYKEGSEFKATAPYHEYKIFTGSPNL
ncbi:hypothetical protein [Chitinophaga sp. GbtcB8]|uniref:hypothetical protein n=1 Tax=Chitinophaga sp. GbtcB8 TaxID=2824753 RepID=UPI001C3007C5|nr:hypothetical protein [Chitinophaga sp. GbtcB8]